MKKKINGEKVSAAMVDLFDKDYYKYLKEGNEYWWAFGRSEGPISELSEDRYNEYRVKYPKRAKSMVTWFKITITYIRAGIVFYRLTDFDTNEAYFINQSIMSEKLIPCIINKEELKEYWLNTFNFEIDDYDYDTFDNSIEIKVV